MRFRAAALLGVVTCAGLAVHAAQTTGTQEVFRAGVDLLQLDVSVLNKSRQPVRGLKASDFTVTIDGKAQAISAFKAVELAAPTPPAPDGSASWIRNVPSDVATNTAPSGRVIAIVIDDFSFGDAQIGIWGTRKARQIAEAVVGLLRPDDRAAVIYGMHGRTSQGFTSDPALLSAAIGTSSLFSQTTASADAADATASAEVAAKAMTSDSQDYQKPEQIAKTGNPTSSADQQGACYCGACGIQTLRDVTRSLRSLPQQRKLVMFISAGAFVPSAKANEPVCVTLKRETSTEAQSLAQRSNVTIQAIDPKGLTLGRLDLSSQQSAPPASVAPTTAIALNLLEDPSTVRQEFLRTVAENTGGRAVVNSNDMDLQVPALLDESSSYYLLGVESSASKKDGRRHSIRVRVNQPDVEVRSRSSYTDPTEAERKAEVIAANSIEQRTAIVGALPTTDLPLAVTVAPLAVANRGGALAVTLAVQPERAGQQTLPRSENVDVVATAFNPETGKMVGSRQLTMRFDWAAGDTAAGQYEVMARVPVPAGRTELRIGLRRNDGRKASVYTYADVPDFARAGLSLSGIFVEAVPSPLIAQRAQLATFVPISPTTRRTFSSSDQVRALVRVYQPSSAPALPATVRTRIVDASDNVMSDATTTLDKPLTSDAGAMDHTVVLPLARLKPGQYLLSFEVSVGDRKVQRMMTFRVS